MGASVEDSYAALDVAATLFAESTDFTIGMEEEHQILDPSTLGLTNRFLDLKAACDAIGLGAATAGELIASEIEVKTGRCETFAEAAGQIRTRRRQLIEVADSLSLAIGSTGTHPFSPWHEQEIIDTPHYRLVEGMLRYIAWRNNTFGVHVHVGIRGADRAMAVSSALRSILPEVLALGCTSPWLEGRYTHLRSTRSQIFTRMFPRCGVPDVFRTWAEYDGFVRFLLDTGSIREHTEIWWSVRPHQSYGTVEIRSCDALPNIDDAVAIAALQVALTARFAHMYDRGEALPFHEHRYIEENFWRALRWGMSRELIDLDSRRAMPAAERIKALLASCEAEISQLNLEPFLAPLDRLMAEGDHASRFAARLEVGEDLHAIFAEQVAVGRESVGAPAHVR